MKILIFNCILVFTNPCISHVFRRTCDHPRYLDEEEEHRKLVEQQQMIAEYKAFRASVEDWRRKDRQLRNHTKEKQILECEELQVGSEVEFGELQVSSEVEFEELQVGSVEGCEKLVGLVCVI